MTSAGSDISSLVRQSTTTLDAYIAAREAEEQRGSVERAARESLAQFIRLGWHVLEPTTPLVWNWHIDCLCAHLEAVTAGRETRVLFNIPPGHMKSLVITVFWPAWVWLHNPNWQALFCSYAQPLSDRDSDRCRDLISSEWYQDTFQPEWQLKTSQNRKSYFANTAQGFRMALSVGGKGTGFRGHCVVFDDLLNVKEFPTPNELETAISYWDKRMSSRLNNMATGVRIGIMQRIHENDPCGHLIKRGTYLHVSLPSEFDPDRKCVTPYFEDPRSYAGELMFPDMFGPEVIAEAKEDLGEYAFEAQHNQNPSPPGGGIFKRHWFRFWYRRSDGRPNKYQSKLPDGTVYFHEQRELPEDLDEVWQSWDMTFKKTSGADRVAGQTWATKQANRFLLYAICRRMSFTETLAAVRTMSELFPTTNGKLVEDKANGPAVMNFLEDELGGFIAVEPYGSKEARAHAVSPHIEAGNVYLPHPDLYPWVTMFMHMVCAFPKASNDDEVDAMTQLLNHMRTGGVVSFLEALTR